MKSCLSHKKFFVVVLCASVLGLAVAVANGRTINVRADGSGDYPTIQAAIDASIDGDTVFVADGIYTGEGNHDINFGGRAITVKSENGPENCIIDCLGGSTDQHRGFVFKNGEGADSILDGFTITHGYIGSGGGIYCTYSSPSILNCIISMNRASRHGGGICCYMGCSPVITNCVFKGNRAGNRGGGIYSFYNSYPVITNCTITDNSAALYGDGLYAEWAGLTIKNSIVWGNVPKQITSYQSTTLATYNNIQGGYVGNGNIDVEPLLTPDSHLRSQSPCLDAGDPTYSPGPGVTDIDGELRVYGSRVDIGVDEFIDTDSDGLPDWWEQKYFADPTIANASDDPDEDGQDNLAEYNGGSDPLQAQIDVFYVSPDGNDDWDGLTPVWDGVHGPKLTIQAGIDTSSNEDRVIVADGIYIGAGNKDIDFKGKTITVRSEKGPQACVIDCEGTGRGFYFHSAESSSSMLEGFTITNGFHSRLGGAIYCDYSSPMITNCIFRENMSGWKGGAIMSAGSKPKIINCLFQNNVAQWGGGLHTSAVYGSSQGPIMTNCTFVDNFANNRFGGGGVYCDSSGKTTLTNCILWGNTYQGGGGQWGQIKLPNPVISYCCIEGIFSSAPLLAIDGYHLLVGSPCINAGDSYGGIGNIDADPYFVELGYWVNADDPNIIVEPGDPNAVWVDGDYRLLCNSPCIDAGDPNYIPEPNKIDLDGNPRIIGGRIDMGVYEYIPNILTIAVSPTRLSFFQEPTQSGQQTLLIRNCGSEPLHWEITEDCNWLQVFPTSGILTGQIDEVAITVDPNGLAPDVHTCSFEVWAPDAYNSPVTIWVTMVVRGILRVPSQDFNTIQDAIDAADNYDVVLVADGTYTGPGNRDIDFLGKAITVRSENGPENCIIDCNGTQADPQHRGFYFHSGEDADSIIEGFTITNGYVRYYDGGGIYCEKASPVIKNCNITGNLAWGGGGGIYCEKASPVIKNCNITGNLAWGGGGGMHNYQSSPTIIDCTFNENVSGSGGGMCNWNGNPVVVNCKFSGNSALGTAYAVGVGGGICNGDSNAVIVNCIFSGNSARHGGGGMDNYAGNLMITNCTFSGNYGSGISCRNSSPTITNCTITGNSAEGDHAPGGGISCDRESNLTITNCTISGNSAEHGGGIFGCKGPISNCVVSGNSAARGGGGLSGCAGPITNCTISGNSTEGSGGGIFYYRGNPTITNCIIWDNAAPVNSQLCYSTNLTYSCIQDWTNGGQGNIRDDPCFVVPGYWDPNGTPTDANDDFWVEGDYHLLEDSPCIDAGTDANVYSDIEGNIRPFDFPGVDNNGELPEFDMGAYEAIVSCFGINEVKIKTDAGKKGDDIKIKGTFNPGVPIDLMIDDVMYTIDDGQDHVFSFLIPAGLFEIEGKGDKDKYKFHSPKGSVPDIKAKFDFDKCKFEFKAKKVAGIDEITSTSLEIILQAGANIAQEIVELEVKGKKGEHLEYKRKPKFECCPEM